MYYGSIYKIVFPNGKHYIGLTTTSLEQRTKEHKYCAKNGDTKCLYNALRKYDMIDTLELIEIDIAETLEELREKEIGYIIEYNSYYMNRNGYNMTYGGDGINGYVFTEEDNRKNSERRKKYYEDNPEARQQVSEKSTKQWENQEAREQMSEIKKKYFEENPEARQQMSEIKKKYYENPEAIQKNREAIKKYYENPEAIQKNREAQIKYHEENPHAGKEHGERMKKYYENPEAIKKCSESQKKRFENPEEIKKCSESQKKRFENPEARQQMSEINKKYWENTEARLKHSERRKKYYDENPEARQKILDTMGKNKQFDVFTKDGKFIKTFTYQFEAKEYLQNEYNITSIISIGTVLEGKRNSSAGFVFKYK
jgi:hypothetical protein